MARYDLQGGGGSVIQTISGRLLVDVTSVSIPPVYSTLFSTLLTSLLSASFLHVQFTAAVLHTGVPGVSVAINFRFRRNGVLIAPGGGTTVNLLTAQIQPVAYSLRLPIVAGAQLVNVEWAGFGLGANIMAIRPLTLPDLMHAQLVLQEER